MTKEVTIRLSKFHDPANPTKYKGEGIGGAELRVAALVRRQEKTQTPLGKHGQLLQLTALNSDVVTAAIIDPATGMQVGYSHAADITKIVDFTGREFGKPVFLTELVLEERFRNRGWGSLARAYLERVLASRFPEGVIVADEIQARSENSQRAVKRIIEDSGAISTEFAKKLEDQTGYPWLFKKLNYSDQHVPSSLYVCDIQFATRGQELILPENFTISSEGIIVYNDLAVGIFNHGYVKFLPPTETLLPTGEDRDYQHWEAVSQLWMSLKKSNFRPEDIPTASSFPEVPLQQPSKLSKVGYPSMRRYTS